MELTKTAAKAAKRLVEPLNEAFRTALIEAMKQKHGVKVENHFNFLHGRLVTTRVDEQDFTPEQIQYLAGFSDGYAKAMDLLRGGA